MSEIPFKNVRGEASTASVVSIAPSEQLAPTSKMDNPSINGDRSDVGQDHPVELPSNTQPFPETNPGAGFKIRA